VTETRLLLVEDDVNVASTLSARLAADGYAVTHAPRVRAAREALAGEAFQVALLDVGLPDGDGFEVARLLRETSPQTALLFLTAHGAPEDRIRGLELGADDYVTKPFVYRELVLRLQNVLKRARDLQRPGEALQGPVRIGEAEVDFARFTATTPEGLQRLTHKECAVLRLLLERSGEAVTRDEILDRAWSPEEFPTQRTVDNFIVRLRRLVERDPANPRTIRSIRGVGYQLEAVND